MYNTRNKYAVYDILPCNIWSFLYTFGGKLLCYIVYTGLSILFIYRQIYGAPYIIYIIIVLYIIYIVVFLSTFR